jgi:hypothetical protein
MWPAQLTVLWSPRCVMISVLATGHKTRGFKPSRWNFKSGKFRRTLSFRGEVNPFAPYR